MEFVENNLHLLEGDAQKAEKLKSLTTSAKKIIKGSVMPTASLSYQEVDVTPQKKQRVHPDSNSMAIESSGECQTVEDASEKEKIRDQKKNPINGTTEGEIMLAKRNPKKTAPEGDVDLTSDSKPVDQTLMTLQKPKGSNFASDMIKKF